MDFRILGSLQVLDEGREVALGGSKQRALLGVLLLHANQTLSSDRLIDELWGEQPPATAAKTVQVHVSRLRKALAGGDVVVTREHGYALTLEPEQLDANRFERLVVAGRDRLGADDPAGAAASLEEALSLWRGSPLGDLAYEPFAQREIARLEDLHVGAHEELIEAKLQLGRHSEVVSRLEGLIEDHPFRERLRGQLILALYRCDRQADALQAYQDARRALVDELGIEPGERLRELERAVLAQDPVLAISAPAVVELPQEVPKPSVETPAPPAGEARRAARRLVSIVFADIVGSTGLAERLDPESMHGLLDRYMDACSAVIEDHGGSVEGFVGDAVVGVFGQNEIHEDDALRAVRTALEIREAGAALSADLERDRGVRFGMKLGVESGEVFVSAGARRSMFAAGDAFNVAARLEGAAAEGEILLGENVYRLLGGAARVEQLEPLALKGRTAKVQTWRLIGLEVDGSAIVRPPSTLLVNRDGEMRELHAALARARDEEACHALTMVGPAGIGKSRLAQELVAQVGDKATVLVGRCLPYGEGVTYRPLAEIVTQLGGSDPRERITELLSDDQSAAELVLGAVGLSSGPAHAEETFWAIRKLFERVASDLPLVVVLDDLHWAESLLLDLLEYLFAFSSGHVILILCLARPELLDARPAWAARRPGGALVGLDGLSAAEARQLVENAGADDLGSSAAARIVDTAEGNPLFLEQLVAMGAENGDAALPSSIQAVLAARLDRLEIGERTLLEFASVQGRSFYVGALEELLPEPDRAGIAEHLVALVHKQLIRADRSDMAGQDAFRFSHALIGEVAYQGMPKQRRAELHERVAHWLEARPDAPDETVGHHLGEACRNLAELGRVGQHQRTLAVAAADRLGAAADAALVRGDAPGGARLLQRAESLLESGDATRAELLPALGAALFEAGRLSEAAHILDEAIAQAPEPRLRARAEVERELVRLELDPSAGTEPARRVIEAQTPVLERAEDQYGQSRAQLLRGQLSWSVGRVESAEEAWQQAAESAHRAGDTRGMFEITGWRALAAALGPTPVDQAIRRCEELRQRVRASPFATAWTLNPLALLHAMEGDFELAGQLLEQAGEILRELGGLTSSVSHLEAWVRLLAGEPGLAEAPLRADLETLASMSGSGALATSTALLGQAVYAQGRTREAGELCRVVHEIAAPDDIMTQVIWRGVQAKVLAHEGRGEEAEALAREAVALVEPTDLLSHHGDAMLDLAEVLRTREREEDSDRAARTGLAMYDLKGNVAAAARARSSLNDRLGGT